MSLLFGDDAANHYDITGYYNAFANLFSYCDTIIEVSPNFLPATTLADGCYSYMFYGCTSLTTTPELPATTLSDGCYDSMFSNTNVLPDCSNIDFTSTTMVQSGGLKGLFEGTKVTDNDLRNILPINPNTNNYYLPATTLTDLCYSYMFSDCTSLTTAPELPATMLANNCYSGMFYNCTSLTTPPELPATMLSNYCYEYMFDGCTSLTTAPELPATTLANYCYYNMFNGCTSLTTAPELPATTLANYCYSGMFYGCTSLTTAPSLPATTLVSNCYNYMFRNCKKLNYIKAMFTTTPSSSYTNNWVNGVASTGTFIKNKDATWNVTGSNGIPSGWIIKMA
jgi:hypothetical protein